MLIQQCSHKEVDGWISIPVPSSNPASGTYSVTIPPWGMEDLSEVICECVGYLFRGHCKHIGQAISMVCNWDSENEFTQTESQERQMICPKCGSKTQAVEVEDEA